MVVEAEDFTAAVEGSGAVHPADSVEETAVLAAACGAMEAGARLVAEPIAAAQATGGVHLAARHTGAAVTVEPIAAELTAVECMADIEVERTVAALVMAATDMVGAEDRHMQAAGISEMERVVLRAVLRAAAMQSRMGSGIRLEVTGELLDLQARGDLQMGLLVSVARMVSATRTRP